MAAETTQSKPGVTKGGVIKSRAYIHLPQNMGERVADVVATGMGSWKFIIAQSIIVGLWIIINLIGFMRHWDAYPFILLNLLFSTQAAYAAPIIMMSQNRQAAKDRLRDDHEAEEVDLLFQINQRQLEILTLLRNQAGQAGTVGSAAASAAQPLPRGAAASRRRR